LAQLAACPGNSPTFCAATQDLAGFDSSRGGYFAAVGHECLDRVLAGCLGIDAQHRLSARGPDEQPAVTLQPVLDAVKRLYSL